MPEPYKQSVPELMSPAGDWDAMRSAVANGADAVYFGLNNFNARHRATNFQLDELPTIMRFLHDRNVKGFLTFNTLIFSDELEQAVDYVHKIAEAGVDALIVQDIGLVQLVRTVCPDLPIHGSTQMTLTEPRGIRFVRELGVSRVVLARELSLEDIGRIRQETDAELEVFVHGALCVAYSGQCLTSESLGGRSANRGQCAQACRLPYDMMLDGAEHDLGDKAYLLSPQDLAAYDLVGDLARLGVSCLKIEGRLKSAHYVAATTQAYRQAIDAEVAGQKFKISRQQREDLEQTFSRGFTHGFLSGVNHQKLVSARFPKSRGVRIGTVVQPLPRGLLVQLETASSLKAGDGVVFDEGHPEQDEQGGRVFAVAPRGKSRIEIELGHGDVNLAAIAAGAIVWRTDDPALRRRLEHSFSRDTVARRRKLNVRVEAHVGQPLKITYFEQTRTASAQSAQLLEVARKFPLSLEILKEQLGRLGDTPYELGEVTLDSSGGPMVPKSLLNDLRREAMESLLSDRRSSERWTVPDASALDHLRAQLPKPLQPTDIAPTLHVMARTLEQFEAAADWNSDRRGMIYCDFEDVRRYKQAVEIARARQIPIALATLRIVKPHELGLMKQVAEFQPDAILIRNLTSVGYFHEQFPNLPLIGDYSLNISNELTAGLFASRGLKRMVPSYDLSWRQMEAMFGRIDPSLFECVIHQHMPMFHMEHCVFAHVLSNGKDYRDCGRPCEKHQVDLRDRVGESHPLIPDVGCRNTVYNARAQSAAEFVPRMLNLGLRHFRVEFLREKPAEMASLLDRYVETLEGRIDPATAVRSLRVLGQLGVTTGTLDRE